jgi:hypothetical protein
MNCHYFTLRLIREVACSVALIAISIKPASSYEESWEMLLHKFLATHLTTPHFGADKTTRYFPCS